MSDVAAVLMTAIVCASLVAITYIGTRAYRNSYEDDKDEE